jgi:hypothetical protein
MQYKKLFDFLASMTMIALGIYVLAAGFGISKDAGGLFYDAPGFLPILLGISLAGCSALLLVSSLKDGGVGARVSELKTWSRGKLGSRDTVTTLFGIVIMFVYSFFMFKVIPFWISSFVFLLGIMAYLKATSLIKGILISAGTVAVIIVFFQVGFRVQLP